MAERQDNSTLDAVDSEELKRYLFFESSEIERHTLEEKFFESDELFYDLLDLENDLTDDFVRNQLGESDCKRFEASLEKSPERRAKVLNAKTLQNFIEEEAKLIEPFEIEKNETGFWEQIRNFFNFSQLNFQYAAAVLLVLAVAGIGFLIYERQQNVQELARLQAIENQRNLEIEQKEKTLQEQIKSIQEREQNLQTELNERRGQAEILTEQLEKEQVEKERLTRELENLKREKQTRPPQIQTPTAPTIATVILAPIGGKGSGDSQSITINQNTATVSATLQIPKESTAESFSVRLNSATLAENLKVSQTKSGNKFVRVSFSAKNLLSDKENLLTATAADGSRFNYVLRRQK